jgi:type I restriction enzyme, S subunit
MPMLERPMSKAGWTRVRFDRIATQINDRIDNPAEAGVERYVGLEHLDPDSLRIRRWGEPTDVASTKLRFQPGDIIFGKRRVYQRKVAVADFEGICSAHAMVLRAKPGAVLPDFLPFFMQSDLFMERALSISVGSLSPTINWKALAAEEFLLPPIQEQARLVEALSAYRNADDALGVAADNLSATRSAYVSYIIGQSGGAAEKMRVGSLLVDGPTNGRSPAPSDSQTGFKTVSISAIRDGVFDPEGCIKFVEMTAAEARPFIVQSGDVFAVRGNGNRNICGRVGISRQTYPDLVYPDLLIRMRFDPLRLLTDFVVAQWNHPVVHGRLISRAKSSNGIWKVNGQDIRAHTLVVPTMDAQREAVQFLSALDVQAAAIHARFASLRDMKRELFKAISGGAE